MKIINVVGARPNFMKINPIEKALRKTNLQHLLVHTGQHYDEKMSASFFDELDIPKPDINLEVGSLSHAVQVAEIMKKFEQTCLTEKPDMVLVVGDVNSTAACSLVASKLGIGVCHVEAGLRSRDRSMPEEINRLVTDVIADLLFTTSRDADENLIAEGIPQAKIHFVGNTMIDSLVLQLEKARLRRTPERYGLTPGDYVVLTLHRPSNVDFPEQLADILGTLKVVQERQPIIFPIHPRTRNNIERFQLGHLLREMPGLILTEPLSYLDFLDLYRQARLVLTDSGGIQEETTYLRIPCITLRENTERPVTVTEGTNYLVGTNRARVLAAYEEIIATGGKPGRIPELWDGHAAERIVGILENYRS
ncbi:MAG: UDP-N-acetylglucosamine 2-epimerase (non-hydrolyzing) [Lentisphaerota bacterium]